MRYLLGLAALVFTVLASFIVGVYSYKEMWGLYTVPRKVAMDLFGKEREHGEGTRFRRARPEAEGEAAATDVSVSDDQISALEALGYASGTQLAKGDGGVDLEADDRGAVKGYYLTSDGDGPSAWIMDETGKALHTWTYSFDEAFPGNTVPDSSSGIGYYRRVALLPNGELLALFEGQGLIKLDANSKLLWTYDGLPHHDIEVQPDGTIYTLTRKAHVVDAFNPDALVLEDFVTLLSAEGKELRRFSVIDAILRSPYRAILANCERRGDIFHTNSLEVIRETQGGPKHPAFKPGNLLLSLRETSTILVIDPRIEEVVWEVSGVTSRQHHPTLLDSGNMFVFDNYGDLGKSRVIEMDPGTGQIVWEYSGQRHDLFTACCGTTYELPSGLILMTEAENGQARIVDRDGKTIWQYRTPHRVGPNKEYVATLLDVVKLPADADLRWLQ